MTVRGKAAFEEHPRSDRVSIVITEIPYQVNKKALVEEIAELVREKRIEGISDLRDESSREGMPMIIKLKRGELPDVVLNNLYKQTRLQMSFGITLLAIVAGRPRVLGLLGIVRISSSSAGKWCVVGRSSSCARRRHERTSSRGSGLRWTIWMQSSR